MAYVSSTELTPFDNADTKMVRQCIKTLNGLKDFASADVKREFNFIIEELGTRLPREVILPDGEYGYRYICPNCKSYIDNGDDEVFCYHCSGCGQLVYYIKEE